MEFDTTVQSRWKASLGCFVVGVFIFILIGHTHAAWYAFHWLAGGLIWLLGGFFALLSLAAREHRRVMGWLGLLLNVVLPVVFLFTFFSRV